MSRLWNICAEVYLAEMLGAEMVGSLSTLPAAVVENWKVEWYQVTSSYVTILAVVEIH